MKILLRIVIVILIQALIVNGLWAAVDYLGKGNNSAINYLSPRLNISLATIQAVFEQIQRQDPVENKSLSEQFFETYDGSDKYLVKGQRLFDISACLLFSVVIISTTLISAVLIKVIDKNGSFISQERFGYKGKIFKIWKLQTMKNGKVTGLGRILRKFGIDELPQFWNVLKGEMTIFGPRPKLLHEALSEEYRIKVFKREQGLISFLGAIVGAGQGYHPYQVQIVLSEYELKNASFIWLLKRTISTVHAMVFPEKREQRMKFLGLDIENYPVLKQILSDKPKKASFKAANKAAEIKSTDKKPIKSPNIKLKKHPEISDFPPVINRFGLQLFTYQKIIQQAI